jgi:hypothetical protein
VKLLRHVSYALVAGTVGLLAAYAAVAHSPAPSKDKFIIDTVSSSTAIASLIPAAAGEAFRTKTAVLKMIRVGVSYGTANEPLAYGAVLTVFNEPQKDLSDKGEVSSVMRKTIYNCMTKAMLPLSMELFDKDNESLEVVNHLGGPKMIDITNPVQLREQAFMCSDLPAKPVCDTKDCV